MARNDKDASIAAIVIGGGLVIKGVKDLLKVRRVQDTASNQIAYAPQGNMETEAYAWPSNQAHKTSHGKYCAYYSCRLEKKVRRNKSTHWREVWKYAPTKEFIAMDHTGAIRVITTGAEVTSRVKIRGWNGLSQISNIYSQVTQSYPQVSRGGLFKSTYRLVESYIPLGSPCYIHGHLKSKSTKEKLTDPGAIGFQSYLKRSVRGQVHTNRTFDANGDGKITNTEVQMHLYSKATKFIVANPETEAQELELSGTVMSSPDHKLIVSDMHEHHFLGHLNRWNLAKVIGGAAIAGFGVTSIFW